ncbi:MAG: hypothetical protein AAF614_35860 [Chloroflexota bacterium]
MTHLIKEDADFLESAKGADDYDDMVCAITTYRYPDKLQLGDAVPDLTLTSLSGVGEVALAAERERPLILIFGSYT